MNQATVTIQFDSEDAAKTAAAALAPDNDRVLYTQLDGAKLILSAESSSIMGLLRTMDDAMSCLRATGMD